MAYIAFTITKRMTKPPCRITTRAESRDGPMVSSRPLSQDVTRMDQTKLLVVHERRNKNRVIQESVNPDRSGVRSHKLLQLLTIN
ncbi:hypothetical protein V6N13_074706 [Hibiscus sabdariffa]|uniref:Uncharacterized protein n=1 Tax=Hibiscus sabdariffa TaxID=183260 RepID=A0ABR2U9S8_9ROSI